MEDAHAAVLPLDEEMENLTALFAVYDGHGGTVQWFYLVWPSFFCHAMQVTQ